MTPEQTFEQLLGLGTSWKGTRTEYEAEQNTFVICVEETEALWAEESAKNGCPVTCYDHVEPMQWRHLNVFNKECVIVSALPRGKRSQDGKIYRVTPPWEGRSKHFSKEFEAFALTLMREMPVKKAGEILSETDQRMWRTSCARGGGAAPGKPAGRIETGPTGQKPMDFSQETRGPHREGSGEAGGDGLETFADRAGVSDAPDPPGHLQTSER